MVEKMADSEMGHEGRLCGINEEKIWLNWVLDIAYTSSTSVHKSVCLLSKKALLVGIWACISGFFKAIFYDTGGIRTDKSPDGKLHQRPQNFFSENDLRELQALDWQQVVQERIISLVFVFFLVWYLWKKKTYLAHVSWIRAIQGFTPLFFEVRPY